MPMNIANKLTVIRILLVPVYLILLYWSALPFNFLWALLVFVVASLTDLFDGKLARKHDMVTDFGKFLDPLADKVLVMAAIVAFIGFDLAHPVAVIIVIAREFMVSGIRLLAVSGDGTVIAANWWGKVKTTLQMVTIITAMALYEFSRSVVASTKWMDFTLLFSNIAMWVVALFTAISGFVYLKQNWSLISSNK